MRRFMAFGIGLVIGFLGAAVVVMEPLVALSIAILVALVLILS